MVLVDGADGLVERLRLDYDQDRSKDLLLVAVHVDRRLQDGRPDKVAVLETRHGRVSAVEENLAALVRARLNEGLDPLLGLRGDERSTVDGRRA